MNKNNIKSNNPIIFIKKVNNNHKIIPLKKTTIVLGADRHFPSATREWYNSIYTYNKNSLKNLSVLDKIINNFIKSYFNLYFKDNLLKSKPISVRFKRLSFDKIFVSKPELKHSNSKVIITLHIYNEEERLLNSRVEDLLTNLYPNDEIEKEIKKEKGIKNYTAFSLAYYYNNYYYAKKKLSLNSYLDKIYFSICRRIEGYSFNPKNIENYVEYNKLIKDISFYCNIKSKEDFIDLREAYEYIIFYAFYEKRIRELSYYKLLLNLNKSKFENNFISKLTALMVNMYNKKIELNIINLKAMNLNSDIFTEAISIKLKNRDNSLLRVLGSSLDIFKFPLFFRIRENYKKLILRNLLVNRVNNLYKKSIIRRCNDYTLNKLLLKIFPNSTSSKLNKKIYLETRKIKKDLNKEIEKTIFNVIKYKSIYGTRIEAKGRLTKRFTASRSVFKLKWKGSLKNIDASYRGWSSVLLRGNLKSNLQYSLINSKTRNGAFGIKGWISGR